MPDSTTTYLVLVRGEGLERVVEAARNVLREQGLSEDEIEAELTKHPHGEELGPRKVH